MSESESIHVLLIIDLLDSVTLVFVSMVGKKMKNVNEIILEILMLTSREQNYFYLEM